MQGENVLVLIVELIVFALVLVATYFVTRWIGKSGAIQTQSANIKVVETFKVAPNKYIQIIQLGNRYYSIGVTKDHIEFLTPLDEEQLDFTSSEKQLSRGKSFRDMLEYLNKKKKGK